MRNTLAYLLILANVIGGSINVVYAVRLFAERNLGAIVHVLVASLSFVVARFLWDVIKQK